MLLLKVLLISLGIFATCVGVALSMDHAKSTGRLTGFYYKSIGENRSDFRVPTYKSPMRAFKTQEECDKWALDIAYKNKGVNDLYYCARNCSDLWGGIDCNDKTGILTQIKPK